MKRFIQTKGTLGRGIAIGLVAIGVKAADVASAEPKVVPPSEMTKANAAEPRILRGPFPKAAPRPTTNVETDVMPIDWAGVLDLARASNVEIQLAVERVQEAHATLGVAKTQWLPSLNLGGTYLKHEGKTQLIPGNVITASKGALFGGAIANATLDPQRISIEVLKAKQQVYAQSGALDRTTRQTLQESSQAYMDLLASQSAAAIAVELEQEIGKLVERSKKWKDEKLGAQIEVLTIDAKLQSQRQRLVMARQNQLAASAQLVHLLHLPPTTRLFANEENIVPLKLVDETRPETELVEQTLDQGPGLGEVFAMVKALDEQKKQAQRIMFLPTITGTVGEGGFGGGTGTNLNNFGNSLDVGVGAYWDVMRVVGASRTGQIFESKRRQATLQQQEINSKLATGVIVARQAAIQARERMDMAQKEIQIAFEAYDKSWQRLDLNFTESGEVMQAIATLGAARGNYLLAVADYNRAQIQLQYLLGEHLGPTAPESTEQPVEHPPKQAVIPINPPAVAAPPPPSQIFAPKSVQPASAPVEEQAETKAPLSTAPPAATPAVSPASTPAKPAVPERRAIPKAADRSNRFIPIPWRK